MPKDLLIVDDEADLRDLVKTIIEEKGYVVDTAADGAEALQKIRSEEYACVVTDLNMPEMSGTDLMQNVGALGFALPFVVLTGNGEQKNVLAALRLGAVDFIEKPFDPSDIERVLSQAIEIGKRRNTLTNVIQGNVTDMEAHREKLGRDQRMIHQLRASINKSRTEK